MKYLGADWLRRQKDNVEISEFGARVADLLGYLFEGLYHIIDRAVDVDWSHPDRIEIKLSNELSSWDNSQLTRMVLLAHRMAIRVTIKPSSWRNIKVVFSQRSSRDRNDSWEYHPTIQEQIERMEDDCDLPVVL